VALKPVSRKSALRYTRTLFRTGVRARVAGGYAQKLGNQWGCVCMASITLILPCLMALSHTVLAGRANQGDDTRCCANEDRNGCQGYFAEADGRGGAISTSTGVLAFSAPLVCGMMAALVY
jgi:hypothetical protein